LFYTTFLYKTRDRRI